MEILVVNNNMADLFLAFKACREAKIHNNAHAVGAWYSGSRFCSSRSSAGTLRSPSFWSLAFRKDDRTFPQCPQTDIPSQTIPRGSLEMLRIFQNSGSDFIDVQTNCTETVIHMATVEDHSSSVLMEIVRGLFGRRHA
jgi:hypothetical protein